MVATTPEGLTVDRTKKRILILSFWGFLKILKIKKYLMWDAAMVTLPEKLARKKAKVVAFDFSSKLIEIAQLESKQKLGDTYLIKDGANLQGIKIQKFVFDKVVANMCLMDIANYSDAISEFARVLKSKGSFIFSITHRHSGIMDKNGRYLRMIRKNILPELCLSIYHLGEKRDV